MPHVNFISNGLDMNELHQIFAAGHPLALCWNWHPRAGYSGGPDVFMRRQPERDHIKQLLEVRRNLKNGLVYGRQTYEPDTGDDDVAAYYYEGTAQCVLTAVNTSTTRTYSRHLRLRPNEAGKPWYNALADPRISVPVKSDSAGQLPMRIAAADVKVYWRER